MRPDEYNMLRDLAKDNRQMARDIAVLKAQMCRVPFAGKTAYQALSYQTYQAPTIETPTLTNPTLAETITVVNQGTGANSTITSNSSDEQITISNNIEVATGIFAANTVKVGTQVISEDTGLVISSSTPFLKLKDNDNTFPANDCLIGLYDDAGTITAAFQADGDNETILGTQEANNVLNVGTYHEASDPPVHLIVGGASQARVTDGTIEPVTDSDIDLGTTSKFFKKTYTDALQVGNSGADVLAIKSITDGKLQLWNMSEGGVGGTPEAGWNYLEFYDSDGDRTGFFGIDNLGNFSFNNLVAGGYVVANSSMAIKNPTDHTYLYIQPQTANKDAGIIFYEHTGSNSARWLLKGDASDNDFYIYSYNGATVLLLDYTTYSATFAGALIPLADDSHDIGTAAAKWKDLYVDGTAYIDTVSPIIQDEIRSSANLTHTSAICANPFTTKTTVWELNTPHVSFTAKMGATVATSYWMGWHANASAGADDESMGHQFDFVPDTSDAYTADVYMYCDHNTDAYWGYEVMLDSTSKYRAQPTEDTYQTLNVSLGSLTAGTTYTLKFGLACLSTLAGPHSANMYTHFINIRAT